MAGHLVSEMAGNLVSALSGHLVPELAGHLVSELAGQLVSELAGHLDSELAGQLVSELAGHLVSELAGQLVSELAGHLALVLAGHLVSELAGHLAPCHHLPAEQLVGGGLAVVSAPQQSRDQQWQHLKYSITMSVWQKQPMHERWRVHRLFCSTHFTA